LQVPTFDQFVGLLRQPHDSAQFLMAVAGLPNEPLHAYPAGSRAYLSFHTAGLQFYFLSDPLGWLCHSVTAHSSDCDGFAAYPHPIEGNLSWSASPADVRSALGQPSISGGGGPKIMRVIVDYPWDRFDRDGYSLRVEYVESREHVRSAALMTTELMTQLSAH
jgi:hypothetical protein